jgi:NAD(P) transhydrogenase subunit alpha
MDFYINFFNEQLLLIYLLLFTIILGFEVIAKVPTVLHTPLMSELMP